MGFVSQKLGAERPPRRPLDAAGTLCIVNTECRTTSPFGLTKSYSQTGRGQGKGARVAKEANSKRDLRLLCCEYLTHLEMLVQTKGDRLKK